MLAIWTMKLPSNIYAHICDRAFNKDTYKSVFEDADKVFLSNKSVNVAAIAATANSGDNLDETVSAFTPQNQPQVAAMGRGRGGGANRGGGRGNRADGSAGARAPRAAYPIVGLPAVPVVGMEDTQLAGFHVSL